MAQKFAMITGGSKMITLDNVGKEGRSQKPPKIDNVISGQPLKLCNFTPHFKLYALENMRL
jgi:hypothetical protein